MRTIGLIGGLSWHSTLEYYRIVNERVAERRGGHASARIVLESLDFSVIRECQTSGDWERAGVAPRRRRPPAARAPAPTSCLICANLMHRVADDVAGRRSTSRSCTSPTRSLPRATRTAGPGSGWSAPGGSWTRPSTPTGCAPPGSPSTCPPHEDKVEVDRIIFEELTQGRVLDGSRATYVAAIGRLQDAGAEALASACTELELLVGPDDSPLPIAGVAADPRRGGGGLGAGGEEFTGYPVNLGLRR